MQDEGVRGDTKEAVGATLAGRQGVLCLRTRCQEVVPRCLSGPCREEAQGRRARGMCKPLLVSCQNDPDGVATCKTRCARYFVGTEVGACERDCNVMRCRTHPPYDSCVAANTLADVLRCFDKSCRAKAEDCLKDRCALSPSAVSLSKATLSNSLES